MLQQMEQQAPHTALADWNKSSHMLADWSRREEAAG
jgi:hypothetical protein